MARKPKLILCVDRVKPQRSDNVHATYLRQGARVCTTVCGQHIVDPVKLSRDVPLRCQSCWQLLRDRELPARYDPTARWA